MKIALAQINTANSDIAGNSKKIRKYLQIARSQKDDLVIFPELCLVGYPPKDFLYQHDFIQKQNDELHSLMRDFADMTFIVGVVEKSVEHKFWNVAHVIEGGKIKATARKNLIPSYDIFDERRYFSASKDILSFEIRGKKFGLTICEDMWADLVPFYENDPMHKFVEKKIDVMINVSASPFDYRKYNQRVELAKKHAKNLSADFIYVNLVGGDDELLFDGGSFVMTKHGEVVERLPYFKEDLHSIEYPDLQSNSMNQVEEVKLIADALTMGLRDFVYKCGFKDVTFGLSGGVDSAVMFQLAIRAFGKEHVHPVFMPSRYTGTMSKEDVSIMCIKSGISIPVFSIDSITAELTKTLDAKLLPLTEENLQARARGVLIMAYAAENKALVLNTTNKSEMSMGYGTMYGDLVGAVSPIGDLYKHQVYDLCRFLNTEKEIVPERVLTREPSAELKENQKDSDSLPPYSVLDPVLEKYIEMEMSAEEIVKQGHDPVIVDQVISGIINSEFKRRQSAPVLRISPKAFGIGRRMPIARKLNNV